MHRLHILLLLLPLSFLQGYDPLELPEGDLPAPVDLTLKDPVRNREIPIRVWMPVSQNPAPVILFSHGLGGSRENNPYLGRHWASRGYVVVFMQHAGSDREVWKNAPRNERMDRLKSATGMKQTMDRIHDVHNVLDQLPGLEPLKGRIDMERIGMSGHSYGGMTTQAVSGQRFGARSGLDKRIDAALVMSPNVPQRREATASFAKVEVPWFLMTGTKDGSPLKPDMKPEQRQKVYDHLPEGDHLMLVLKDAEHHAFGDGSWRKRTRNPNHHRVILALSTAFWDAHLHQNQEAELWLKGEGAKPLLEPGDVFKIQKPIASEDLQETRANTDTNQAE